MVGKRLRSLRMKNKLTQQKVADALVISLNAYQKYEQGERFPSLEMLVKLADMFHAPTDFILGRDDYLRSLGVSVDEFL